MKKLYLYNTASRSKELFEPVNDPVGMYCCGPTVYNYAHIGNLRTYVFEDVLKRTLLALGYKVKHVMNITDVGHLTSDEDTGEDKMEKGALREGKSVWDIANIFTEKFKENISDLNILNPDIWPKATDHISQMIRLVQELENRGFTYRTSDGIYFDTSKFPSYCDFAHLDPNSLRAGERVDMGEKRFVTDFALWKFSPTDSKRQMEWDSPWGVGFPGWHIECSAMSMEYLPQPIDIHCGGSDHIRVHHSNEIAQSEAATGKKFVKYWLHGEFLVLDKGKMAKSGGGFITLDSVKDAKIPPLAYRLFCFTAHYRSPLSFSWEGLRASAHSLSNLYQAISSIPSSDKPVSQQEVDSVLGDFFEAVCDDLNMPRAMAAFWSVLKDEKIDPAVKSECVKRADQILALGLTEVPKENVINLSLSSETPAEKQNLPSEYPSDLVQRIGERLRARASRDYKTADLIRDELTNLGITIKDLPDGGVECSSSKSTRKVVIKR